VHIRSDRESVDEAATKVITRLIDLDLVPRRFDEAKAQAEIRRRLAALGFQ
jgi:hypothetical protein